MDAWYFTFEYPPAFGGGLSTYMAQITRGYARKSGSLVVFTLDTAQPGLMTRRFLRRNIQLITLNPMRTCEDRELGRWVNASRLFERLADLIMMQIDTGVLDLKRPDYMEFADGFGIGALTIQQKLCRNSRFSDIPIVVNAHTPTYLIDRLNQIPVFKLPTYWTAQMELQALRGADLVIAPSQAVLDLINEDLATKGTALDNAVVLPNPYSADRVDFRYDSPTGDTPCDHVFMASRLTHWKGVENAILAMERLWDKGIEVPFHIYGEDTHHAISRTSYSAYLKKKYARHFEAGLIVLKGKVPRHEIVAASRSAYAQIHPSLFDNLPYSVLESACEGNICVAGRNGGIGEVLREEDGMVLVDVTDAQAFSRALEDVMALSAKEREGISRRLRARVQEVCAPDAYFDRKERLVEGLGSDRSGRMFPFLTVPRSDCVFDAAQPAKGGPELSVVIPYFNMGLFIDETIASIKESTAPGIEIVLIDDGSTDPDSQQKLTTLNAAHGLDETQLRIISIPNGGVANARNRGVQDSRAPLITLLDADDLIAPRYYEKAMRILRTYPNVSFVGSWIEDFNTEGRIRNWATSNAEPPLHLIMNQTNCQSLVYKREAFLGSGQHDPDLRMFLDDWDGVIALMAGGHRGVMIPEPLFRYRIRDNSIFRSAHNLWDLNYEKITQKHRALYNEWGADIAAFLNVNGPNNFYHIAGKPSAFQK